MEDLQKLEQCCKWTIFDWKHPTLEIDTKGTLLADMASRFTVVRIWKTSLRAESLGNVSSVEAKAMLKECYFRDWLASQNVRWDPQPGEAGHGALEFWAKCWMSSKMLPRELHDVHLTTLHVIHV